MQLKSFNSLGVKSLQSQIMTIPVQVVFLSTVCMYIMLRNFQRTKFKISETNDNKNGICLAAEMLPDLINTFRKILAINLNIILPCA